MLVTHLGRRTRDQPSIQNFTVGEPTSDRRAAPSHPVERCGSTEGITCQGCSELATVIMLRPLDAAIYRPVLEVWKAGTDDTQVQKRNRRRRGGVG